MAKFPFSFRSPMTLEQVIPALAKNFEMAVIEGSIAPGGTDKNVDGGAPDSVYLPSQRVDGGEV